MMTYEVLCGWCKKLLAKASHIVDGIYCDDECCAKHSAGRRPIRDNPQA